MLHKLNSSPKIGETIQFNCTLSSLKLPQNHLIIQTNGIKQSSNNICYCATTQEISNKLSSVIDNPQTVVIYPMCSVIVSREMYIRMQVLNSIGEDVFIYGCSDKMYWFCDRVIF